MEDLLPAAGLLTLLVAVDGESEPLLCLGEFARDVRDAVDGSPPGPSCIGAFDIDSLLGAVGCGVTLGDEEED